jgi:hypothetical protein
MVETPFTREEERDCFAALWRDRLFGIPSTFGRLLYMASLRDISSGHYREPELVREFGAEEADRAIRFSHNVVFADWLTYTIEQQVTDLDLYLSALRDNKRSVLRTWLRLEPYRNLVPEEAPEHERRLFLAEIEAVLTILQAQFGPEGTV